MIMSLAPMLTAVIGWFFWTRTLSALNILAIVIGMAGIVIAISNRQMKLNIPFQRFFFFISFWRALGPGCWFDIK